MQALRREPRVQQLNPRFGLGQAGSAQKSRRRQDERRRLIVALTRARNETKPTRGASLADAPLLRAAQTPSGNAITATITAAERAIRERIRRQGKIPFAEFMRLALYHPKDGYYTSPAPFGATGDYYTSPAAHPAFGALLCVQIYRMWQLLGEPPQFTAVELGAGNGLLAADIIAYAPTISPQFASRLRYICIDRYAPAIAPDAATPAPTDRLLSDSIPLSGITGCIISNELVDAFPVHRFRIADGQPLEIYVGLDANGDFREILDAPSTPLLPARIRELGFALPDGFRGEARLDGGAWMREVAQALAKGFVITIDYGHEARELYSERRRNGTLQTYYQHTQGGSPYQRIGNQDISAFVDFTLLQSDGRAAGLDTLAYTTQADLLIALGMNEMLRRARATPPSDPQRAANLMAMRELVNPSGLGGFKALIQGKRVGATASQLSPPPALIQNLRPRLLTDRHMPLMQGRYPQTSWELPDLWPPGV